MMHNAITEAFSLYAVKTHYGVAKAKAMATRLFNDVPLSNEDAPLPKWAEDLLCSPIVGFRERVRIALLHQRDITGRVPNSYLVKSMGKRPLWMNRSEAIKTGAVMARQRREEEQGQSTEKEQGVDK